MGAKRKVATSFKKDFIMNISERLFQIYLFAVNAQTTGHIK